MSKKTIWLLAALLSSCALTESPERQMLRAKIEQTRPICSGNEDCQAKWEAAQLFVVKHAGYKIQIASSVLIETYNPTSASTSLAMRVTKEPLGGGQYKIIARVWCDNPLGCVSDPINVVLAFNHIISQARP